MKKVITISGKEYTMKSSAYTQFKYKDETGRKMLGDLQNLTRLQEMDNNELLGEIDDLTEVLLKMAYVMIEEADPNQVKSYEEFLKGIESLYDNQDWINEVITLAAAPISRGIQNTPQH